LKGLGLSLSTLPKHCPFKENTIDLRRYGRKTIANWKMRIDQWIKQSYSLANLHAACHLKADLVVPLEEIKI